MRVPFFRVELTDREIQAVESVLRSGWLTTGAQARAFEERFAEAVGARHAVAVSSATAAMHLAVEALGLRAGQAVLVPTMTFAATAEVVRYFGAVPVLVDCDPVTGNLDLGDAEAKLAAVAEGRLGVAGVDRPVGEEGASAADSERRDRAPDGITDPPQVVGILPVHVGGLMLDVGAVRDLAQRHGLWVVEDAAHAFPAAWRPDGSEPWQQSGEGTAEVTCFSFYANKTITTGEGGMAVTDREDLAERMRVMALHGLSKDAWGRYTGDGSWDYRIVAPGFKYNLTDVAAALGVQQLGRAEALRRDRERVAHAYLEALAGIEELELPPAPENRIHSWHLFPIRLRLDRLTVDRNRFVEELRAAGVGFSVHWRPLHLHPYYAETFGWRPEHLPVASALWTRLVSLPIFPGQTPAEVEHVVATVGSLCRRFARRS